MMVWIMNSTLVCCSRSSVRIERRRVGHMRNNTSKITAAGLFAAMITIMTAYICHIPYGANGGYIHFGDALIYLGAVFLPRPYALAAAAIGGGMADLLTAPMWAPATIIIKMLITLPFTSREGRIMGAQKYRGSIYCRGHLCGGILSGRGDSFWFLCGSAGICWPEAQCSPAEAR